MRIFFTFLIVFYSVLAQAQTTPTAQPSNLIFSGVKAYGTNFSFQGVSGVDEYLVLRSLSPITGTPGNNIVYTVGDMIGSAKVIKADGTTITTLRGMRANTKYYFAVFSYNRDGNNTAYLTTNPLIDSLTTPGGNPGNYYAGFNPQSPNFVSDLTNIIFPHNRMDYGQFDENVVANILQIDTVNGERFVACEYSNQPYFFTGIFVPPGSTWTETGFSREHIFPRSWMRTSPTQGSPEHDDYHNLALVNNNQVNIPRSNFPMGYVVSDSTNIYYEAVKGKDADGNTVYEVRDEFKGDVARAIFYMAVAYNGKGGSWAFDNLPSLGPSQNIELLKEWHFNDLPDNLEIAKHEFIYDLQNNRNPFIDYPDLVDCINFRLLVPNGICPIDSTLTSVKNNFLGEKVRVFPNPSKGDITIEAEDAQISKVEIYSLTGAKIFEEKYINNSTVRISAKNYEKGMYLIKIYVGETALLKNVLLR
jgi:hypothetical protein